MEINEDTLDLILSDMMNESFWYFELGRNSTSPSSTGEHQFMNSFFDQGKKIWDSYKSNIQEIFCDKSTGEPNQYIKELIEGNVKDLIVNIISLLTTTYSLTLAVAIPLAALILKKGFYSICKL